MEIYRVLVQSLGSGFTILAVLAGKANPGMAKLLMARRAEEVADLRDPLL